MILRRMALVEEKAKTFHAAQNTSCHLPFFCYFRCSLGHDWLRENGSIRIEWMRLVTPEGAAADHNNIK
jgi:hypothetical protein